MVISYTADAAGAATSERRLSESNLTIAVALAESPIYDGMARPDTVF